MSRIQFAWIFAAAFVVVIAWARWIVKRNLDGGYQRRFSQVSANDDAAFPIASTLYVGDGGGSSHAHHYQSTDCAHHSDGGAGCSDGGGSSH